jgi:capsular exopolysaccharide synthesis family protein
MGRLNKALERIKNERGTEHAARRTSAHAMPRSIHESEADSGQATPSFFKTAKAISFDHESLTQHRIISSEMDPGIRTSYKMLRTRILHRMKTNGWKNLVVTSATPGDGKTVTAINLAISLSGEVNHEVCLVDLDLRRSSIADYLGISPTKGISDYLARGVDMSEIILRTDYERLTVVPNVIPEVNSSEFLSSPRMRAIADELVKGTSRFVIYDMPPVLAADDVLAFEPLADAILFVTSEGKTSRTEVMKACELLDGTNIIGTVLNRSDQRTASYY